MMRHTRREFLAEVGKGMITVSVGCSLAAELGLASAEAGEVAPRLTFGALEPLVELMQETPIGRLVPTLVAKLNSGVELRQLAAAAALANARTFGGEDYVGFHTMMALAPAVHMSAELPAALQPLPVLKVLYRNTNRIHEHGGRSSEVLGAVEPAAANQQLSAEALREAIRSRDAKTAEGIFAAVAQTSAEAALNDAIFAVQDDTEVHRVVLPYRSWDMLGLIGKEHAQTLLRQSVRYCLKSEEWSNPRRGEPAKLLATLLDEHHLLDRAPGTRLADDAWIDQTSKQIFEGTPQQAAEIAAGALADGFAPVAVGEAISLAANQLILRDIGRTARDEVSGKPMGSVHGDSIGVHACDSANAWRNLSRVSNPRNTFACLILGAYQVALDRVNRGGDFLHWQPLPLAAHLQQVKSTEAAALLGEAEEAIRGNMQAHAAAIVHRYGELGHAPRPLFDLMLKYAISEDGSLHAEKFYRTTSEEFAIIRPSFRWRQLVALARVTASEYGRPAAGIAEARSLLKV
jgi:hypothetical protein